MSEQQPSEPRKILIVDDEPDVVTYLETLLQDNGYATVSAPNGKVGFQLVKSERPDLVCLDITMPEESGIRFYRNVKESAEYKSIPVVFVTAVTGYGGDPGSIERFLGTRKSVPPPEGFFSKPIERDEFLDKINSLLGS